MDVSEVREEQLEELRTLINDLVEFVEANEPRPIACQMFLCSDRAFPRLHGGRSGGTSFRSGSPNPRRCNSREKELVRAPALIEVAISHFAMNHAVRGGFGLFRCMRGSPRAAT
jgi:hypothetical protein